MNQRALLNPLRLRRLLGTALVGWLALAVLTTMVLAWPREAIAAGNSARLVRLPPLFKTLALPHSAAFRPDGGLRLIYLQGEERRMVVMDPLRQRSDAATLPADCDPLYSAVTPDRARLACWRAGGIRLSGPAGSEAEQVIGRDLRRLRAITFSADGSRLAAIGVDAARGNSAAYVWTLADGAMHLLAPGVPPLALSPDGGYLAYSTGLRTLSTGENIRVWALAEPPAEQAVIPMGDMSNRVAALAVSPGGDLLAVADGVGRVRLYAVATRLPQVTLFVPGRQRALSLAFSADGRTLLALAFDGAVWLWAVGVF